MRSVPPLRVRTVNDAGWRREGAYVLYWMIANRRPRHNFALQRAVGWALELGRPLVVLEALRAGYEHASDRLHRFVIDGMRDNAAAFADTPVLHHPYVEPEPGAGAGLLEALAEHAAVVVTDDWPCFFLPRMVEAAGARLDVTLEAVDACGLLPLRATDKAHTTAYSLRRHLQKVLPDHLEQRPLANPLARVDLPARGRLPRGVASSWPAASRAMLEGGASVLADLPIDHEVAPVPYRGGTEAARRRLRAFVKDGLARYADEGRQPSADATSRLSPWLHFGHVSSHEVFEAVARKVGWSMDDLAASSDGSRKGWWGMSPSAEAFLDQLVTWRELGFNFNVHRDDAAEFDSLPDFARETLEAHADDERPHVYDLEAFERAATHDRIWNAAQGQLRREGHVHNYLRMLWGKKILHWSESPRRALEIMLHLNDRWAVDGRDPNSTSGILWCLGRYDRAWGPEREVFGKVRYMTSESTASKLRLGDYLARYAPDDEDGEEDDAPDA